MTDVADVGEQRRSILEKRKMLWGTSEVCYLALLDGLALTTIQAYRL